MRRRSCAARPRSMPSPKLGAARVAVQFFEDAEALAGIGGNLGKRNSCPARGLPVLLAHMFSQADFARRQKQHTPGCPRPQPARALRPALCCTIGEQMDGFFANLGATFASSSIGNTAHHNEPSNGLDSVIPWRQLPRYSRPPQALAATRCAVVCRRHESLR